MSCKWCKAMAEIGLRSKMLVKDVMSSPVITVGENEKVDKTAQLMKLQKLGCIIVTDKDGRPIGIITERDLVNRVLAENKLPGKLVAKDVMTSFSDMAGKSSFPISKTSLSPSLLTLVSPLCAGFAKVPTPINRFPWAVGVTT